MGITPIEDKITLPLLPALGINGPIDLTNDDVQRIATSFIQRLTNVIASGNVESVIALFIPNSLWRDLLAFTWDFNTLFQVENIRDMLNARLEKIQVANIRLAEHRDLSPTKFNPMPALLWVNVPFLFETVAGSCTGIAKLVPVQLPNKEIEWKVFSMFTNLDEIKGHPDKIGPKRRRTYHSYVKEREKEVAFEGRDPQVIIIGAGQSGLNVAARLAVKDVSYLVIDKNETVGDNWRERYDSLALQDPSWLASPPYFQYPQNWPAHTPSAKYADWLEMYAKALDLNIWTSSTITKLERDDAHDQWIVHVQKRDGTTRTFHSKYIVAGLGLGKPYTPNIPGMEKFQGKMLHSYSYKNPEVSPGKKVVVIGTGAAGHDISADYAEIGTDVTMVQRGSTCVIRTPEGTNILFGPALADNEVSPEIKDRLGGSFPMWILTKFHRSAMKRVIEIEKPFYDALQKTGFKINHGPEDAGFPIVAYTRIGGYYIDVAGSQMIIDGKIKVKNGSIKEFTSSGMIFEDGSILEADVVIFATGMEGPISVYGDIMDPELWNRLPPYGLSNEGEFEGVFRECGLPNFFPIIGNLPMCRFYSSHIALIIKAKEVGLFNTGTYKQTEGL